MAKKFFAEFSKNGEPYKATGPYYGDLNEALIFRMIKDMPKGCDDVFEVIRRTDGHFFVIGYMNVKKGTFHRAIFGDNYGPGQYGGR